MMMNKNTNSLYLLFFVPVFLCCDPNSFNQPRNLKEDFTLVSSIRENQNFIPLSYIDENFSIAAIDFQDHNGIKKIGVKNLVLERSKDDLLVIVSSENPKINNALIKITPFETGFYSEIVTKYEDTFYLYWDKSSKNLFRHNVNNAEFIKFIEYKSGIESYDSELKHLFILPNYILFAIRELYFKSIVEKLEGKTLVFESFKTVVNSPSPNNKIASEPECEYYPSVYVESICTTTYVCSLDLRAKLNSKCSNQYCIGCCRMYIEQNCLFGETLCALFGYGHACDGNSGGGSSDCLPNKPCGAYDLL